MKRIPKLSEAAKKKATPNPSLVSVISARDTKATQVSPQDTTSGAAANKVVYMNITRERKRHKSVSEVAKKEKMRDSRIGRVLLEGSVSRSPSPQELVSPPSNRRGETSLYGIRRPVALPGNTLQAQKTPSLKEKDVSQLNSQQPPSEQQRHCTDSAGNSKARLEKSNNPVPKNLPQKARRTFSHNGSQVASGGAPIGRRKEGKQPSTKKRRMNLKKVGFQKFETVVVQDKSPKFIPPEKAKKRVQKPQGSEQVEQRQEGLYNHVFSDTVMVALNCALQKLSEESSIPPVTQPSSHKPGSEQSSSTHALALPSLSGNIVQMRTLSVQGSRVVAHVVKPQPQMSVAVDLSSSTTTPGQRPDRALALKPSSRSQHATEPPPYTAALKVPPPSRAGWETVLFGDIAFADQRSASGTERQDKCRQSPLLNKQPTVSGEISRRPSAVNSERMSAAKSGEKSAPGLDLCHQESIQASVANAETLSVSSQKNSKTSLREDGAPRPVEGDASGRSLQITRVLSHGGRKSQTDDPVGPLCTRSASMSEIRAAPKSSSATQPQRSGVSGVSDPRRTSTTETAQVPGSTPSTQTTGSSGVSGVRRMSATETAHLGSMKHQSSTQTTGSSGVSGVRRMSATETAHLGSMKHQSSTQTTGSSGVSGVSDPRRTSTTETAHTLQVPGSTPSTQTTGSSGVSGVRRMSATETAHLGSMKHQSSTQTTGSSGVSGVRRMSATETAHLGSMKHQSSTQTTGSSGVSGVRRMSATETAHLGSMKHQSSTQTTGSSGVSGVRRMSATETAHLGSMKHQSSTQTTGSSGVSGVRRMSATETAHLGSMKHQSSTQTTGSSGVSGVSDPRRTSATEAAHSGKVPASKSSGGGSRGPPVPRKIVSTHLKLPLIPPTLFSRYKKSHTVNFVSEPVTLPSSSETPNTCHLSPAVQKMQDKVIFETAKLKLIELRKDTPCTRAVDKTPSSSQVALDTPTCPAPNDPPCGPPQSPKDLPPPLSSVPRADTDLQSLSTTPKRKGGPPLSPQPVQEGSQQNSTSPQGQSCPQLQSASKSSNKGTAKLTPGPQLECVTGEASSDGPAVKVQPPAVSPSSPPVTMSSPLHQMARAREKSKSNSPKLDFIISSLKSKKTGCGSGPEQNSDHCGRRREKGANHSGSETELNAAHSGRDADHNGIDADHSGRSVDHSGRDADHSGRSVDHSGRDADHSGRSVDHSGRDADHSGRSVDHSGRDADHSGRSVNHSGRDADDSGRSVNHSGRDADDNGGGVDHSGRDADHSGRSVNHSGRYADDNGGGVDHSGRDADHSSRSVDHSGTGSEESAGSKTEQNVDHNSEKGPENVAKCTASDAGASLEITVEGRSKKIKRKKSSSNVPETTKKLRVISKSVDSSGGKRRRAEDTTTQPTPRKKQSKKVCIALEASKKV